METHAKSAHLFEVGKRALGELGEHQDTIDLDFKGSCASHGAHHGGSGYSSEDLTLQFLKTRGVPSSTTGGRERERALLQCNMPPLWYNVQHYQCSVAA